VAADEVGAEEVEKRMAEDGELYTRAECLAYYGDDNTWLRLTTEAEVLDAAGALDSAGGLIDGTEAPAIEEVPPFLAAAAAAAAAAVEAPAAVPNAAAPGAAMEGSFQAFMAETNAGAKKKKGFWGR
jgi:hypothetical protein